jgi:hypothetical protein
MQQIFMVGCVCAAETLAASRAESKEEFAPAAPASRLCRQFKYQV